MKEKESQAMEQKEQSTTTQQATASKPRKNGVFMMRGKDQSWEEFKKVCIQRLIDARLIKEGSGSQKTGFVLTKESVTPDEKDPVK
jgi:hypothetical protein